MKKIGIFSSFAEPAAQELVDKITDFVSKQYDSQAKISFIFSNRELGESPVTDKILKKLKKGDIPMISLSAANFEPQQRKLARELAKTGDDISINLWRNNYADKVIRLLPPTDFDLLLGDWWIWGENLCQSRTGLNLHPALPDGPKGEWFNVIWDLIRQNATESGIMMHKVIPELDRGPVATYCKYSVRGPVFDDLWARLPTSKEALDQLIEEQAKKHELSDYPLHVAIRKEGFKREIPLILSTVSAIIDDQIDISGQLIKDSNGETFEQGYDLTDAVESIIKSTKL